MTDRGWRRAGGRGRRIPSAFHVVQDEEEEEEEGEGAFMNVALKRRTERQRGMQFMDPGPFR